MVHRLHDLPCRERSRALEHRHIYLVMVIDNIFQNIDRRIASAVISLPRIAGTHLPRIENRVSRINKRHRILRPHSEPRHQRRENLSVLKHTFLQGERISTEPERINGIIVLKYRRFRLPVAGRNRHHHQ